MVALTEEEKPMTDFHVLEGITLPEKLRDSALEVYVALANAEYHADSITLGELKEIDNRISFLLDREMPSLYTTEEVEKALGEVDFHVLEPAMRDGEVVEGLWSLPRPKHDIRKEDDVYANQIPFYQRARPVYKEASDFLESYQRDKERGAALARPEKKRSLISMVLGR